MFHKSAYDAAEGSGMRSRSQRFTPFTLIKKTPAETPRFVIIINKMMISNIT